MRSWTAICKRLVWFSLLMGTGGCGPEGSYRLRLEFPSQEALDATHWVALWVINNDLITCEKFMEGTDLASLAPRADEILTIDSDQALRLQAVPPGTFMFLAEARSKDQVALLRGCTGNVEIGAGQTVLVELGLVWVCVPGQNPEVVNGKDDDCDGLTDECAADPDCEDQNPCTEDRCMAQQCLNVAVPNTTPCEDGLYCTEPDTCQSGVCVGATRICTGPTGVCEAWVCNEAADACELDADEGASCDDGDACTVEDACSVDRCRGTPLDDDGDGHGPLGCPGGDDCDDADPQIHPGVFEGPEGSAGCADGVDNDCDGRTDADDPTCNRCVDSGDCDDLDACNGVEACGGEQCQPGSPPECADLNPCTADGCDAATGCQHDPVENGTPCPDGLACNGVETCLAGACTAGTPVECSDGDPCTRDLCDEAEGCVHQPETDGGSCGEDDPCVVGGTCQQGVCQGSLPDLDADGHAPVACGGDDCDDSEPGVHPGAAEGPRGEASCSDGLDNDCDRARDDADDGCGGTYVCNAHRWCWEKPRPALRDLYALWASGADDIWAAGQGGLLLHWVGTYWACESLGIDSALHSLWGFGPDDVWLGGAEGVLKRFDGAGWSDVADKPAELVSVMKIWGTGPEDLWILDSTSPLGFSSRIFHRNAGGWHKVVEGAPNLAALWGAGSENPWGAGSGGAIYQWNGASFDQHTTGGSTSFYDVAGISADRIWAVGSGGGTAFWNGTGWSTGQAGTKSLIAVWPFTEQNVWAVGDGGAIQQFNGMNWLGKTSPTPYRLNRIWGFAPDQMIAVGAYGTIVRSDGQSWTPEFEGTSLPNANEVVAFGPDDVWFAADSGKLLHFDGEAWTVLDAGTTESLEAICGSGPTDIWLSGTYGTLIHYDGEGFTPYDCGAASHLWDLACFADDVWAVGLFGYAVRWRRGTDACEISADFNLDQDLQGVWGVAPDDIWAVGDVNGQGLIVHYNGSRWSVVENRFTDNTLYAVWGTDNNHIWTAGWYGMGFYGGSSWQLVPEFTNTMLRTVFGTSASDVWALHMDGDISHWNGSGWTQTPTGGLEGFMGMGMVEGFALDATHVWLVGTNGVVLRYRP